MNAGLSSASCRGAVRLSAVLSTAAPSAAASRDHGVARVLLSVVVFHLDGRGGEHLLTWALVVVRSS